MLETERELAKLGVPIKTRHNEVAPAQYEVAPIFENSNVGSDHQQLTMQIMQNVARRYGLVCLLHEKPFAGVNGSGKHNNWSMGTDTGSNLLEPGATPHENHRFLFFCAAVIQAVNKHQALLRASIASPGQDHRLGANEAPPAIISIFLGAELEKVYGALESGSDDAATPKSELELGVLGAARAAQARRRPQPDLAVRVHRQQVRVPRARLQPVAGAARTRCSTRSSPRRSTTSRTSSRPTAPARTPCSRSCATPTRHNKQIVFDGDNYSEEWHKEAEERGLFNLKQTPDALPWLINEQTVEVFSRYDVLSERELESRYEVSRRAVRDEPQHRGGDGGRHGPHAAAAGGAAVHGAARRRRGARAWSACRGEIVGLTDEFVETIFALEEANAGHPETEDVLEAAKYVQSTVIPAMEAAREVADRLERIVPDSLWPLPKYAEILFIK